jgi:hypothetical protein
MNAKNKRCYHILGTFELTELLGESDFLNLALNESRKTGEKMSNSDRKRLKWWYILKNELDKVHRKKKIFLALPLNGRKHWSLLILDLRSKPSEPTIVYRCDSAMNDSRYVNDAWRNHPLECTLSGWIEAMNFN